MIARRLVVHGRVQGVGFRFAMTDAVSDLGVATPTAAGENP